MNKKNIIKMGTAGLCMLMLTGCGGQNKKTYDQAVTDLEQGSYDYALEGYKSSITAGYKSAESYRGAGYSCLIVVRMDSFTHDFHLSIILLFSIRINLTNLLFRSFLIITHSICKCKLFIKISVFLQSV